MVYVLRESMLGFEEKALAQSLQGLINRHEKCVYVCTDWYMEYLTQPYQYVSLQELFARKACLLKGYFTYNCSPSDVALNMSATISAAFDVVGVPYGLEHLAQNCGLKKLGDLATVTGTAEQRQKQVFDRCKHLLNADGLVHQVVRKDNCLLRLRDFAISQRWACIYTTETPQGRQLLHYVLSNLDKNIAVLGWTDDELPFVEDLSAFGDYVIPMDWSANHSFWGVSNGCATQKKLLSTPSPNKHYLAIVVSDGDNIQWLERDFATTSTFGQRLASDMRYKINFTVSPSLTKFGPAVLQSLYDKAQNERFLCGVSGVGYCNPMKYPFEQLQIFGKMSAEAMQRANLPIICLLDNVNNVKEDYQQRLDCYAQHDYVKGGIWELDPDRYGAGQGRIWWSSNDKPFVSVRYSLWPKEGKTQLINDGWIQDYADQINALPANPTSERGYTVLNVNPWTVSMDVVDQVVQRLDDHVELVFVDELINLVKNNVKR